MSIDQIFSISSNLALAGWLVLLIISPFWFNADKLIVGIIVTLLAIVYSWLIAQSFHADDFAKFGSLDGIMELFTNKTAVAAGWVHYLAFDLMLGTWIKKNAEKQGIQHWILIPILLCTFMLGPFGLLLYLLVRFIKTKQYFAEN